MGTADQFTVRVLDPSGRLLTTLRRDHVPARSTPADLDALIDHETAGRSSEARTRLARFYESVELPQTLPAYTALVVDALDLVWVRGYARAGLPFATWSVFSPAGALIAEVSLPAGIEVYEIGADYVLGRGIDPDAGTPEVLLHRLARSGPPR